MEERTNESANELSNNGYINAMNITGLSNDDKGKIDDIADSASFDVKQVQLDLDIDNSGKYFTIELFLDKEGPEMDNDK